MRNTRIDEEACWTFLKECITATAKGKKEPFRVNDVLQLFCFTEQTEFLPYLCEPAVVIVAQGNKIVRIGKEEFKYGENIFFLSGIEMPVFSCIPKATPDYPYIALALKLDSSLINELAAHMPPPPNDVSNISITAAQKLDADLLNAVAYLLEASLSQNPKPILCQILIKEIHYHLMSSPSGVILRRMFNSDSQENHIYKTIDWIKQNYSSSFTIAELATKSHMAPSTFHKYFKAMMRVSPLQFQKRLRLSHARVLLAEGYDVTHTAMTVGYESATQFTREYKRLYGESPKKSVKLIKQTSAEDKNT